MAILRNKVIGGLIGLNLMYVSFIKKIKMELVRR